MIVADVCRSMAVSLRRLMVVLDPDLLVLGGGIGTGAHKLVATTRRELGELAGNDDTLTPVVTAGLGHRAGLVGATLLGGEAE